MTTNAPDLRRACTYLKPGISPDCESASAMCNCKKLGAGFLCIVCAASVFYHEPHQHPHEHFRTDQIVQRLTPAAVTSGSFSTSPSWQYSSPG